jgi:UDP-glucose 4-epimerase
MITWVVGRGLIGTAVARTIGEARCWRSSRAVHWADPVQRDADLADLAAAFFAEIGERPWQIVWCAGSGVIGTEGRMLAAEVDALRFLLASVGATATMPGTVFVSSSAGGVYAGAKDAPFTEETASAPVSPYGEAKLAQEDVLRTFCTVTGHRGVIGRIANVYGPGQDLSKPQGLVSQICLSLMLQRPLTLYVPLDTTRDYVFVDDCARMIVAALDDARLDAPGTTVRLIASGSSATVGQLLSVGRRVVKRHLPIVTAPARAGAVQARDLRLRPLRPFPTELRSVALPTGLRRTFDDLVRQMQAGGVAPSRASGRASA